MSPLSEDDGPVPLIANPADGAHLLVTENAKCIRKALICISIAVLASAFCSRFGSDRVNRTMIISGMHRPEMKSATEAVNETAGALQDALDGATEIVKDPTTQAKHGTIGTRDVAAEYKQIAGHASRLNSSVARKLASPTCLLHVSYGEDYMATVDTVTLPIKEAYARKHGYELKIFQRSSLEELVATDFKACPVRGMHMSGENISAHAILKFCGIWDAFESGCDLVLWTDSDAIIYNSTVTIEQFVAQDSRADVYWSVSDNRWNHGSMWCLLPNASHTAPIGCVDYGTFLGCLNTGAFIIRRTDWSRWFVGSILEVASTPMPMDEKLCDMEADALQSREQCWHFGDQCIISCMTRANRSLMDHYACFATPASPTFQRISVHNISRYEGTSTITGNTFVVNCAGNDEYLIPCIRDAVSTSC